MNKSYNKNQDSQSHEIFGLQADTLHKPLASERVWEQKYIPVSKSLLEPSISFITGDFLPRWIKDSPVRALAEYEEIISSDIEPTYNFLNEISDFMNDNSVCRFPHRREDDVLEFHFPHNMHVASFSFLPTKEMFYSEFHDGEQVKISMVKNFDHAKELLMVA